MDYYLISNMLYNYKMLVLLYATADFQLNCFSADVDLVGNALDKTFTLTLSDAAFMDPSCGTSKGKDNFLQLNFIHVDTSNNKNMLYI